MINRREILYLIVSNLACRLVKKDKACEILKQRKSLFVLKVFYWLTYTCPLRSIIIIDIMMINIGMI